MLRLMVSVLVTTMVLAGSGPPNPKKVNLALGDMPPGFTLSASHTRTNAQAAVPDKVSVALYNNKGRLLSYEVEFKRDALIGLLDVDSNVIAFKSASGAKWEYNRGVANVRKAPDIKAMSAGQLGTARMAFTTSEVSGQTRVTVDAFLFWRGSYVVTIIVAGVSGTFTPEQAIAIAHKVDQHIQRAK